MVLLDERHCSEVARTAGRGFVQCEAPAGAPHLLHSAYDGRIAWNGERTFVLEWPERPPGVLRWRQRFRPPRRQRFRAPARLRAFGPARAR